MFNKALSAKRGFKEGLVSNEHNAIIERAFYFWQHCVLCLTSNNQMRSPVVSVTYSSSSK